MPNHNKKINRIIKQLKTRKSNKPVSLKKKTISHEVPKINDKRYIDEKIDISNLNEILHINTKKQICIAEPGVTFVDLVKATMKHNLVPIIVPELKTITIGWAIAGCSIESMSFKHGGFYDTCLEFEIITAKGELLNCTPKNENKLIFKMVHGTFGTLWIISKLTFKLIPSKKFVKIKYKKYNNLQDYKTAIRKYYQEKNIDFMDGIIHSPTEYILNIGNFVDDAPYTHHYNRMKVYYKSTKERKEDYLKTPDYFFRYDKGVTNVTPSSFLWRLFFGKFIGSTELLKIVKILHRFIPEKKIPITVDLLIPFSKSTEFMKRYKKEINFFPLRCVPYKTTGYERINPKFLEKINDNLFLDIAIYGLPKRNDKNYYKMIEKELMEINAIKTLISGNYYNEKDFRKIRNKNSYDKVKKQTDPNNIFRNLYTKTCKTMRGLEK